MTINTKTLAAIDIGTNAIRLFISNVEEYPTETLFKKIAFLRVPIRLGEDVFTTGEIGQQKRKRLCRNHAGILVYHVCIQRGKLQGIRDLCHARGSKR